MAARDVLPGETVSIKVEVSRLHVYTDDELDELKRLHITELPAAEAEAPAAEEAAAEGGGGGGKGDKKEEEQQPQEGWWVIGESIRKSLTATQSAGGKTTTIQAEEVRRRTHFPIHTCAQFPIHTPRNSDSHPAKFRFSPPNPSSSAGDAQRARRTRPSDGAARPADALVRAYLRRAADAGRV